MHNESHKKRTMSCCNRSASVRAVNDSGVVLIERLCDTHRTHTNTKNNNRNNKRHDSPCGHTSTMISNAPVRAMPASPPSFAESCPTASATVPRTPRPRQPHCALARATTRTRPSQNQHVHTHTRAHTRSHSTTYRQFRLQGVASLYGPLQLVVNGRQLRLQQRRGHCAPTAAANTAATAGGGEQMRGGPR